jgi:hypothetical protein
VVFFFELFDAVDDFFLLDVVELACGVDASVVVARAGRPSACASKQNVRKRAKRRPKELTDLQCSAIFPAQNQVGALSLQIHRQGMSNFLTWSCRQYSPPVRRLQQ